MSDPGEVVKAEKAAAAAGGSASGGADGSDVKPAVAGGAAAAAGGHINLKVVGQDNNEVFFKIKRQTPLKRLMDAYCERQGKDPKSVRFMFDGERLQETDTPDKLEMEDNDKIDVFVSQIGGSLRL